MDGDPHEIIITTQEDSNQPRVVEFLDLYDLRNDITTMMYLWNANSYFVDVVNRTFIINGGRKLKFGDMGPCRILYRRRNQQRYATNDLSKASEKVVLWLLGLEEIGTKRRLLLIVSEDGVAWRWANKL